MPHDPLPNLREALRALLADAPAPPADAATEAVREAAADVQRATAAAWECPCIGLDRCEHDEDEERALRNLAAMVISALSTPAPAPSAPKVKP